MENNKETLDLEVRFNANLGTIATDMIPKINAYATAISEPYKTAIVTEDGVSGAKKDRAKLNAVLTAIDNERKRIKKIWDNPLKDFEAQLKEAVTPIANAIENIDSQVDAFEEADLKKRQKEIADAISKDAAAMGTPFFIYVSTPAVWSRIYRKEYTNKSYSRTKAQSEWQADLQQIKLDLEAIGDDEMVKGLYTISGNLAQAQTRAKEERALHAQIEKSKAMEASMAAANIANAENGSANEKNTQETEPQEEENPFTSDGKNFQYFTTVPPKGAETSLVKATRTYGGEKWKVLRLLEFAEALGLDVVR